MWPIAANVLVACLCICVSVEHNSVILQKRQDRSMRHLGYGLGWAEGTRPMRYLVARMRSRKGVNFGGFPSH